MARTHRTVSVRQVLAAMEDDGYAQAFGSLHMVDGNGQTVACAIGQAGLNLGVSLYDLEAALGGIPSGFGTGRTVGSVVVDLNDNKKLHPSKIAQKVRLGLSEKTLEKTMVVARQDHSDVPGFRGVTVPLGAVSARR